MLLGTQQHIPNLIEIQGFHLHIAWLLFLSSDELYNVGHKFSQFVWTLVYVEVELKFLCIYTPISENMIMMFLCILELVVLVSLNVS